jgi:hypothetical protein
VRRTGGQINAAEGEKVRRSTEAIERFGIRRRVALLTEQRFTDYKELHAKVASQGAVAIERARHFASLTDVVIPPALSTGIVVAEANSFFDFRISAVASAFMCKFGEGFVFPGAVQVAGDTKDNKVARFAIGEARHGPGSSRLRGRETSIQVDLL